MLKAYTGLEGGLVANGSTCGVVTGGAAGIALMHADALSRDRATAESGIMALIRDYTRWFEACYGSCLCRKRTGVNFHTAYGQARYFFPGDRTVRCLWHIRGAARYLHEMRARPLPVLSPSALSAIGQGTHCAGTVLAGIKEKTGLADDMLNQVAFIFDGGVGFSGGVCGALTGAVLGINLKLGMDIRNMSFVNTVRDFIVGHLNLLVQKQPEKAEPFYVGKTVVRRFKEHAGAIECAAITGGTFSGYPEFGQHIGTSVTCRELMGKAVEYALAALEEWQ